MRRNSLPMPMGLSFIRPKYSSIGAEAGAAELFELRARLESGESVRQSTVMLANKAKEAVGRMSPLSAGGTRCSRAGPGDVIG